jgi:alanyl-tRNA synthetase/REP element-mobilizing transposase RayT
LHPRAPQDEHEKVDIAFRVIADHIRTLSFAIADGIQPSNEGRGYVLRRILRRAVRYGRTLGFHEPFLFKLVGVVVQTMGDVFPEVRMNESRIKETIQREEEAFNKTLDKGIALFETEVARLASEQEEGERGLPARTSEHPARGSGARYRKRRLPHYERPHGIYHVAFSTRQRRVLSPQARTIVLTALRHFHQKRYDLFAVCVMSDHVHVLLQPMLKDSETQQFFGLDEIFHSIKSFTANEVNKVEGTKGQAVWEEDYHDRLMRSDRDVEEKFHYICSNPWTEGLAGQDEDYAWVWTFSDAAAVRQDAGQSGLEARAPRSRSGPRDAVISGTFAFRLYDEQGFPLDLTQLMARERGLSVDVEGFEKLMEEQRARGRSAQKKQIVELSEIGSDKPTNFLGYDHDHTGADVQEVFTVKDRTAVVLNNSVCYAEMGGQVGDTGEIVRADRRWQIANTQKAGNAWVHLLANGDAPAPEDHVTVQVDVPRRRAIERHHTVTHLLHWALHEIVSRDAVQKGSYVGPEKLTFDFSSAALTREQVREVEKLVNERIAEDAPVSWTEIPYAEAKKRSDIQQFFGDKYGDVVRVVQIGGKPNELNGYSMELCGGTHVRVTGEIGSFRILREEAIAAGIRRIEAVAGEAARAWAQQEAARQQEKFEVLVRKKSDSAALPAFLNELETKEMLASVDARVAHLEKVETEVRAWEKQNAKAAGAEMQSRAATIANELIAAHAGKSACVARVQEADGKMLQAVVDALKTKFSGPIFLAGAIGERVSLIASVPKELTSKFQAGKLIQEIAPIVGGRGGGRPELAQGGGADVTQIEEALAKARALLA